MGAEDIERQAPNVLRMRALGAEVRSVTSGTATLKDAVNEAMRDWVTNVATTHYVLGSAMGPHPYPDDRARPPATDRRRGRRPAPGDRGAAARPRPRLRRRRLERDRAARAVHRRAVGPPRGRRGGRRRDRDRPPRGRDPRRHARDPARVALVDAPGPRRPGRRGALGIGRARLPGHRARSSPRSPRAAGIEVAAATDREAVAAMRTTTRTEGILPALETAHAVAALPKLLAGVDGLGRRAGPTEVLVPARLLGARRQGPRGARALRRRRAVGGRAMTIDELRAFCLALPGTHEQETWGDAEHGGDVTFRVRGKIYLITGPDGGGGEHPDRPRAAGRPARRVPRRGLELGLRRAGSGGSPSAWMRSIPRSPGDHRVSAWRRTAPKAVVAEYDAAAGTTRAAAG